MNTPVKFDSNFEILGPSNDQQVSPERMKADQDDFIEKVTKFTGSLEHIITDESLKFSDRIDRLLIHGLSLLPVIMSELAPHRHIVDSGRSEQAMKVMSVIKGLESSLYKKKEMEAREEVDISHPKFQKALDWVMEGVLESMTDTGIDAHRQANFIHNFSQRMVGFEAEANKKLKGTSFNRLDALDNPLIKEFNEERKG